MYLNNNNNKKKKNMVRVSKSNWNINFKGPVSLWSVSKTGKFTPLITIRYVKGGPSRKQLIENYIKKKKIRKGTTLLAKPITWKPNFY